MTENLTVHQPELRMMSGAETQLREGSQSRSGMTSRRFPPALDLLSRGPESPLASAGPAAQPRLNDNDFSIHAGCVRPIDDQLVDASPTALHERSIGRPCAAIRNRQQDISEQIDQPRTGATPFSISSAIRQEVSNQLVSLQWIDALLLLVFGPTFSLTARTSLLVSDCRCRLSGVAGTRCVIHLPSALR
ncbi:hypothetical protein [Streptomyces noursei]|uniref:hypothetical protein n=1 Tax=Streptomyces noursei TaxID=1971 RepID=UPI00130094FE|nr:hypothetical protein [Streptomyces noursei]